MEDFEKFAKMESTARIAKMTEDEFYLEMATSVKFLMLAVEAMLKDVPSRVHDPVLQAMQRDLPGIWEQVQEGLVRNNLTVPEIDADFSNLTLRRCIDILQTLGLHRQARKMQGWLNTN